MTTRRSFHVADNDASMSQRAYVAMPRGGCVARGGCAIIRASKERCAPMQVMKSLKDVRRVVTGERSDGASYVVSDGSVPHVDGPISFAGFWATDPDVGIPVHGPADEPLGMMAEPAPKVGQTRFGAIWYPPRSRVGEELIASAGANAAPRGRRSYPGRHATMSYDYIIIMQGEIWLQLDEGEVLLKAGDFVVQGGVAHSWHNKSDQPCLFYCIIIGAQKREV